MKDFNIGHRIVGPGHAPFIIAEVAQSHDGNLNFAHAFIDAVANTGADAIKFQTHIADAETTPAEPWRVKFSRQDDSRYAYWKRMEFSPAAWRELAAHAHERGLIFLSSPFSLEAVDLLESINMAAWKIASGEVNNPILLERIARVGKPVLLSSGMSTWAELDAAVALFKERSVPTAVMQCTSAYPCPPERIGLNVIPELAARYGCHTGLSDHSATIYPGIAAVALGSLLVEVHVTFHPQMFGPDVPASITMEQLKELVQGAAFVRKSLDHPIDKQVEAEALAPLRNIFTKSATTTAALKAGQILAEADLTLKKPGTGVPAAEFHKLLGRTLARDLAEGVQLQWTDLLEG